MFTDFRVNFACQTYGMTASPNMKEISDANPSAFSPQPFAIAGFFGPQQILQLLWMRELYRADGQVEQGTIRYAPWYALGNFLIGGWMLFWVGRYLTWFLKLIPELKQPEGRRHPCHHQHPYPDILCLLSPQHGSKHLPEPVDQHCQHHICRHVSLYFGP